MWNFEEIGNDLALKMMIVDGVREPTLSQIQENSNYDEENSKWTPAWKFFSDPHPGIPKQFLNKDNNDLRLAMLPYSMVNYEVHYKAIIKLHNTTQKIPSFNRLRNGTIILTGHKIPDEIEHNIEIFLYIHDKLIPCYYTSHLENVIIEDPSNAGNHIRCYYLAIENAVIEASFLTSRGKVIHRCEYKEKWLHGSTSYQELCNAIEDKDKH